MEPSEINAGGSKGLTSIRAGKGARVNLHRWLVLPPTRDLILGTLLALSILGNVFLFAYAKDAKTMAWVAQDQVNKFMTNQLPALEARIQVTEALVNAYGLKKEISDERDHHQSISGKQAAPGHR